MGQIGCPETSVRNYHYSLRNNPEELLRSESLESRFYTSVSNNLVVEIVRMERLGLSENLITICMFTLWYVPEDYMLDVLTSSVCVCVCVCVCLCVCVELGLSP